jgi:hypothetical protein
VAVAHISRAAHYVAIHLPPSPCFLTNFQIAAAQKGYFIITPIPIIKLSEKVFDAALFDKTLTKLPG